MFRVSKNHDNDDFFGFCFGVLGLVVAFAVVFAILLIAFAYILGSGPFSAWIGLAIILLAILAVAICMGGKKKVKCLPLHVCCKDKVDGDDDCDKQPPPHPKPPKPWQPCK